MGSYPVNGLLYLLNKLYYLVFWCRGLIGALVSIRRRSFLGAWLGLEVSLLSFIPIILDERETERPLKYFLIQAWASLLVLAGLASSELRGLALCGLLIKLGAAPFYSWYPLVVRSLNWKNNFFIATVLKIAPLALFVLIRRGGWKSRAGVLSCLVGTFMGVGESCLRKLMAYSSISHLGWVLAARLGKERVWILYFVFYILITGLVITLFHTKYIFYLKEVRVTNLEISVLVGILSLGGFPPFLGFYPKWIVIRSIRPIAPVVVRIVTILRVLSLYYYINLAIGGSVLQRRGKDLTVKSNSSNVLLIRSVGGGIFWGVRLLL